MLYELISTDCCIDYCVAAAAWVPAAISAVGSVIGGLFGSSGQHSANKMNQQIARETFAHDKEMWQLENEYNTPANQMARYHEAGLNPNLMYGSINPGNSSGAPTYHAPRMENPTASLAQGFMSAGMNFASLYQQAKMNDAEIEKKNAEADVLRAQVPEILQRTTLFGEQTSMAAFQTVYWQAKSMSEMAHANVAPAVEALALAIQQQTLKNMSAEEKRILSDTAAKDVQAMLAKEKVTTERFMRMLEKNRFSLEKKAHNLKVQLYKLDKNKFSFDRAYAIDKLDLQERSYESDALYKEYSLTLEKLNLNNRMYEFGVQHEWTKRKYLYDTLNPTKWWGLGDRTRTSTSTTTTEGEWHKY